MWCEKVLRNVDLREMPQGEGQTVDFLDLTWEECKRVVKKASRGGQPISVLLPLGQRVRHGDVLVESAEQLVVVNVIPCEVMVARGAPAALLRLALELGNLHCPVQLDGERIIFPEDPAAVKVARSLGVELDRQMMRFEPIRVLAMPQPKLAASFQVERGRNSTSSA